MYFTDESDKRFDESDIIIYNVKDIQRLLQIGKANAYQLLKADGFPSFTLNKRMYVTRNDFTNWIKKNRGKTFNY